MTQTPREQPPLARDSHGRFSRALDTIERDRQAAQLITRGWSYAEVTEHLGYSDRGTCHRAVQKIRREAAALDGSSEQIRQRQLAEIAEQRRDLWDRIINPAPTISRTGKIVVDDDGNEIPDAAAIAAAHALLIRLSQREASIRGTDAPKRSVTLTGRPGPDEILAFVENLNPEDLTAAVILMRRRTEHARLEAEALESGAIPGTIEPQEAAPTPTTGATPDLGG